MIVSTDSPSEPYAIPKLLDEAIRLLSANNVENPRLNAERLLCQIASVRRVDLYLDSDHVLTPGQAQQFQSALSRRASGEPLQYILGEVEFMSMPFKTDQRALIPRPDTEILVEHVLHWCRAHSSTAKPVEILEVGTGSGCIAVSLARYLPHARIVAVDVAGDALSIARENARLNAVEERVEFLQADVLADAFAANLARPFDAIVSNPPYVALADYTKLAAEIREFEPEGALHDNGDGMVFFRRLASLAPVLLRGGGLLAVEVGLGQAQSVKSFFEKNGAMRVTVLTDFNGIERVVTGQRHK